MTRKTAGAGMAASPAPGGRLPAHASVDVHRQQRAIRLRWSEPPPPPRRAPPPSVPEPPLRLAMGGWLLGLPHEREEAYVLKGRCPSTGRALRLHLRPMEGKILLALLARPYVQREALVELLYPDPDDEPEASWRVIAVTLTALRKALAQIGWAIPNPRSWTSPHPNAWILRPLAATAAAPPAPAERLPQNSWKYVREAVA